MPHIRPDFNTKKAFREALKNGDTVEIFQPGPFGPEVPNGEAVVEAPAHFHKWYAQVEVKDGIVVKLKK